MDILELSNQYDLGNVSDLLIWNTKNSNAILWFRLNNNRENQFWLSIYKDGISIDPSSADLTELNTRKGCIWLIKNFEIIKEDKRLIELTPNEIMELINILDKLLLVFLAFVLFPLNKSGDYIALRFYKIGTKFIKQ